MATPQSPDRPSRPAQDMDNFDESYWQQTIKTRPYYRDEVGFDKYREALRYGSEARRKYGADASFDKIEHELASSWKSQSGLSWSEARGAIEDAWKSGDTWKDSKVGEAVAQQGGFDHPPTFDQDGSMTPRGRDEPNH